MVFKKKQTKKGKANLTVGPTNIKDLIKQTKAEQQHQT